MNIPARKLVAVSFLAILCVPILAFAKTPKIQGTIPTEGHSKSEYSSLAKISLEEATKIALKQASGKVVEAALEEEKGFLVYEVEVIGSNKARKEFLIDAGNGQILHVKEREHRSTDDDDDASSDDEGYF